MAERDDGPTVETLERGNLYFFYRPRVEQEDPGSVEEIQNLYMVLAPHGRDRFREAIVGRKVLPQPEEAGRQRFWGFVRMVRKDPKSIVEDLGAEEYRTRTRGARRRPAARPAGEGIYRILRHDDHTHLVYAMELPERPGEVQEELNLEEEASYVISVNNPEKPSPARAGLPKHADADYPQDLAERFRGRRFAEVDPPEFLDREGCEFVLVGAAGDVEGELGIELRPADEEEATAEIFRELRLEKSEHPVEPLVEGAWE